MVRHFKFFFVFCLFSIVCLPVLVYFKPEEVLAASPETFTSSGTYTAATGIYAAGVACWGGGGGGGIVNNSGGGGGGGGAYAASSGVGVTPGTGYAVVVGAGGVADQAAGGGDSSFGGTTVVADGGLGTGTITGALGGTVANSTGTTRSKGGDGKNGYEPDDAGGGGGGAGGPDGAGVDGTAAAGNGLGGVGGAGNAGIGGTGGAAPSGAAGGNGGASALGGGGGGGGDDGFKGGLGGAPGGGGGGSDKTGGNIGGTGQCIITYTDTWAPSTTLATYSPTWSFASVPINQSATAIGMTATTGYDYTAINYLFTNDNSSCGANAGIGGTSSSWQSGTSYTNSGLQPNKCYGYKVTARDETPNTGTVSSVSSTYTSANTPGTPALESATLTTLTLTNDENSNPSANPATYYAVQVVTTTPNDDTWINKWVDASGNPSATAVWQTNLDGLVLLDLNSNTTYGVKVKARNQEEDETALSAEGQGATQSVAVSITLTTDGSVSYDIVGLGQTAGTTSAQKETVSVESGPATLKARSTLFSQGGNTWALGTSSGVNIVKWEFSKDTGSWTTFEVVDTEYPLDTNVPQGETRDLYLRITMPIETASYETYSASVTIVASTP